MDEGQRQADSDGGKARRGMFIGRAMDNQQEATGQDNFNDDSRQHGEAARGVFAIAIGGKSAGGGIKAGFTAGHHVKHRRGNNAADHLSDNIANDFFRRETAAGPQAQGHRRVEMPPGNMADRKCHG
ncbi:Uncharacterised protein [Klebsiella aerogenes]|nr:Uncharacterised protein [Klebsiella aerogenes]